MAPIPKRSDQLHGHRKPPKVTKAPAAPRWVDEDGNIYIACREVPEVIACSEVGTIVCSEIPEPIFEVEYEEEG